MLFATGNASARVCLLTSPHINPIAAIRYLAPPRSDTNGPGAVPRGADTLVHSDLSYSRWALTSASGLGGVVFAGLSADKC